MQQGLKKIFDGLTKSHQKAGAAFVYCVAILTDEWQALHIDQKVALTLVVCVFIIGQAISDFGKGAKMLPNLPNPNGDA